MTDEEKKEILCEVLQEIDNLMSGSEKCITQPDDPSGLLTEWVLDTEAFRDKLQKRIMQLDPHAT